MFNVLVLISLLSRSVASPTLISNLKQISSRTLHQGGTSWCLNSVPGPLKTLFVFIRLSAQSIVVWLRKSRIKKYALPIFLKVHRTLFWSRMTQDDIPGVRGAPGGAGVDGWRQRYLVKKSWKSRFGEFLDYWASTDQTVQKSGGFEVFHIPWHVWGVWKTSKKPSHLVKFGCGSPVILL